jgi:hypothetical protein
MSQYISMQLRLFLFSIASSSSLASASTYFPNIAWSRVVGEKALTATSAAAQQRDRQRNPSSSLEKLHLDFPVLTNTSPPPPPFFSLQIHHTRSPKPKANMDIFYTWPPVTRYANNYPTLSYSPPQPSHPQRKTTRIFYRYK